MKARCDSQDFSITIKNIIRECVIFRDDIVVNPPHVSLSPRAEYSFSPRKNVVSVVEKGGSLLL